MQGFLSHSPLNQEPFHLGTKQQDSNPVLETCQRANGQQMTNIHNISNIYFGLLTPPDPPHLHNQAIHTRLWLYIVRTIIGYSFFLLEFGGPSLLLWPNTSKTKNDGM